jgi:pimeloyl-ACP methyl ester carboxylesterase
VNLLSVTRTRDELRNVVAALALRRNPRGDEDSITSWRRRDVVQFLAALRVVRLERSRFALLSLSLGDAVSADLIANHLEEVSLLLLDAASLSRSLR